MTILTDKTRAVLAELFDRPAGTEWTARDIAAGAGVAANVAGALLGRLIAAGFVADRRDKEGVRLFRIVDKRRADAGEAVGVPVTRKAAAKSAKRLAPAVAFQPATAPASLPPVSVPREAVRAAVAAPEAVPVGVTTVGQIRAAYGRGEVSAELLRQVERAVAETVKSPARR